jgi:site-specific recombinase XerC
VLGKALASLDGLLLLPALSGGSTMDKNSTNVPACVPWNKCKIVGQKAPLKPKDIWSIRVRLQMNNRIKELALFNLGFDSKLRGCDLVALRVRDVCHGAQVASRAMVMQQKTHHPVQFEITPTTRESVESWIRKAKLNSENHLFPSRIHASAHIGTRQYARILHHWVEDLGFDSTAYGTHSMRRSKASMIYKKTKNLRAGQILLGHTKLESTVRYLGIEIDDALDLAEQLDI